MEQQSKIRLCMFRVSIATSSHTLHWISLYDHAAVGTRYFVSPASTL